MMRRLFPSLLCLALWAAEPSFAAADADLVKLSATQISHLGIETLALGKGAGISQKGLPAQVVVPSHQLRVIASPLPGVVDSLLAAPGMPVKKGQVLARLLSPQALELQRDLQQSGSQSQLARQTRQRDELLFKEGLIPESRVQASRATASQAEAAHAERQQSLALAGSVKGASLSLVAPMDGVVLEQSVNPGQRIEAATALFRIGKLTPLWLEVQVPVEVAARLKPGLSVSAGDSRGRIITVGQAVGAGNQTVLVRALINEGAELLRPGQAVQAQLELPGGNGMDLPTAAVARNGGRSVVFVQTQGGFKAMTVRVLSASGDVARVEGVQDGAHVAVKGVSSLKAVWLGVGKD